MLQYIVPLQVGWVVDSAGIVHFQCGVVPARPRGSNLWWQVRYTLQLNVGGGEGNIWDNMFI